MLASLNYTLAPIEVHWRLVPAMTEILMTRRISFRFTPIDDAYYTVSVLDSDAEDWRDITNPAFIKAAEEKIAAGR